MLHSLKQQIIDEKRDLDTKIIALCSYIHSDEFYKNLYTERTLLSLQFKAMMEHSYALAERIENLNFKVTK